MPIERYGVLRGKALEGKLQGKPGKKPHYQIHILAAGVHHRIAVNVVSDQSPSELQFLLEPGYQHPILEKIAEVAEGYHPIPSQPGGLALDFIRGTFFDPQKMKLLPHDVPGPDNDLNEIFSLYVRRAIDRNADVYAFGAKWGPENGNPDDYFGFEPGNGIHDIHLNQGSPPPHKPDNGIWQDGALFIHFPAEDEWLAFFLAFQSQHAQTDERGDLVPGSPKFGPARIPEEAVADVRIVAALVNPSGDDAGRETVTLLNLRPEAVNLSGWKIANATGGQFALSGPVLGPGDTTRIAITNSQVPLSNKGGTISLLDPSGKKVHGVAYTKEQVAEQGWTNVF